MKQTRRQRKADRLDLATSEAPRLPKREHMEAILRGDIIIRDLNNRPIYSIPRNALKNIHEA